jgi:hypothetical protein
MAFKKGHKGYKKKGTKNKDPLALEERAKALGVDVFEILNHFAAGAWQKLGYDSETYVMENAQGATKIGYTITPDMRLKASTDLMKYMYPQKRAVELSNPEGQAFKVIIEDYSKKND